MHQPLVMRRISTGGVRRCTCRMFCAGPPLRSMSGSCRWCRPSPRHADPPPRAPRRAKQAPEGSAPVADAHRPRRCRTGRRDSVRHARVALAVEHRRQWGTSCCAVGGIPQPGDPHEKCEPQHAHFWLRLVARGHERAVAARPARPPACRLHPARYERPQWSSHPVRRLLDRAERRVVGRHPTWRGSHRVLAQQIWPGVRVRGGGLRAGAIRRRRRAARRRARARARGPLLRARRSRASASSPGRAPRRLLLPPARVLSSGARAPLRRGLRLRRRERAAARAARGRLRAAARAPRRVSVGRPRPRPRWHRPPPAPPSAAARRPRPRPRRPRPARERLGARERCRRSKPGEPSARARRS